MPFVSGFLRIRSGDHPDHELPGGGAPDNELPGAPVYPDQGLPAPPPGVWPPLTPSHPIQPAPPGTPPGVIWPPVGAPPHPDHGLPPSAGHPDQGLPPSPGHPDQGLPRPPVRPDQGLPPTGGAPDQGLPSKTYWVVCGIPGVGWRYVAVDPSLTVSPPIAPTPAPKPV
jgi:hypothetical protein